MEIRVNLEKRGIFILIISVALLISAIAVYASSNPAVFGHTADEISGLTTGAGFSNYKYFPYNGSNQQNGVTTYSWTAPSGVSKVKVRMWGPGLGSSGTAGAQSGSYIEGLMNVVSGTTYTISVGSGSYYWVNVVPGSYIPMYSASGKTAISSGNSDLLVVTDPIPVVNVVGQFSSYIGNPPILGQTVTLYNKNTAGTYDISVGARGGDSPFGGQGGGIGSQSGGFPGGGGGPCTPNSNSNSPSYCANGQYSYGGAGGAGLIILEY